MIYFDFFYCLLEVLSGIGNKVNKSDNKSINFL